MHKKKFLLALGATCLLASTAYAKGMTAQSFVTKASIGNQFEIESSQLALEKSENAAVRDFADDMVEDHTEAGNELSEALESSSSKAQPAENLDSKHQKLLNKLKAANGTNFDKLYITMQGDAHKEAIALFDAYAKNGTDESLKEFAQETLPTLREHYTHWQEVKKSK